MRFKTNLILIIFLLLNELLLAKPAHDESLYQPAFEWRAISFPFDDNILSAVFSDSLNGWAITDDKIKIYRFQNGKWYITPLSKRYEFYTMFGYSNNNIWISCYDKQKYRYFLRHYDGEKWENIYPPNTDKIRGLNYIAPDNIWGACEWGEIIHYDGKKWSLIPSPVFGHLNGITMVNDSLGWLMGEYRGNSILLRWDGRTWNSILELNKIEIRSAIMINGTTAWAFSHPNRTSVFLLKNDSCRNVNFSSLVRDTIYVSFTNTSQPILYHLKAITIFSEGIYYLINNSGQKEILYPTPRKKLSDFYWFTSDGSIKYVKIKKNSTALHSFLPFIYSDANYYSTEYGVAFGDFDNDGDDDIYSINTEGGNSLQLFAGNKNIKSFFSNTFIEAADRLNILGINKTETGEYIFDMGVSYADVDNDGDSDIYLTCLYGKNQLYENKSGKKFQEVGKLSGVTCGNARSNVGIWGDVDNDGHVDLFVTNEDTTNMLFLNDGAGQFKEITGQAGLISSRGAKGATFGDLDLDGDLDLVVPFFGLQNKIYRNEGINEQTGLPFFKDMTAQWLPRGPDSLAKSASASLADIDNDGDLDLYIANLVFSNRLYENDGTGKFTDITLSAGLVDSSLSHSGCFFDADNDGDLDLLVANRGENLFFTNIGDKKFIFDNKRLKIDAIAYSTGLACGDPDNDGDIDCYLGNNDQYSVFFRNTLNNHNFLKIKLTGIKSNRAAIGAKSYLYVGGHLNDNKYLLGLREVNGGYGYGSMNSTVIHYGVQPERTYDLKICFPSGIEIVRTNLSPGQFLKIEEQSGWVKEITLGKKALLHCFKAKPLQKEYIKFALLLALFMSISFALARKGIIAERYKVHLSLMPFIMYFLIVGLSFENGGFLISHVLPVGVALFSFALMALLFIQKQTNTIRLQLAEELLQKCRAFDHGSWARSYLNQLQLFSTNLAGKKEISAKTTDQLKETMTGFYELVYKEIEYISRTAIDASIKVNHAAELGRQVISLSQHLDKLKVALTIQQKIKAEIWQNIFQLTEGIKTNINKINSSVTQLFSCEAMPLIHRIITRFQQKGNCEIELILLRSMANSSNIFIKPTEFTQIMDNLFENSFRAMQAQLHPEIKIILNKVDPYFIIEFCDNGCGIHKELWESIFDLNFTTKKSANGGFGLYYSRMILNKYGGSIEVIKSRVNSGTTFLIMLRLL